jgi:hypothetical protein
VTIAVDEFEVADPADAWTRVGFSVDADAVCRIGGVRIRLVGRDRGAAPAATLDTGTGIVGWSLRGLPSDWAPSVWSHAGSATAAFFGDRTTPVKDAVQPGRRITTLRHRDLGMSVRTAMISPPILGA